MYRKICISGRSCICHDLQCHHRKSGCSKENGQAARLYQGFWTATNEKDYEELYGYATGIYENAYSCDDLQGVIKVFDDSAAPEKFKELTESYSVEDAKARIFDGE